MCFASRSMCVGGGGSAARRASRAARAPRMSTLRPLELGNWVAGLVVLTLGVLLPLALTWRRLFGGATGGAKRSQ